MIWWLTACGGEPEDTGTDPCAGGEDAIFVRADGSSGGTGACDDPLDSLADAVDRWPGSGAAAVILSGTVTGDPVRVLDASWDGLVIEGTDDATFVPSDPTGLGIEIRTAVDVRIDALTLSGGTRAIYVADGADVTATGLVIDGAQLVGALVAYGATLTLTDFEITNTTGTADDPDVGYGAAAVQATLDATHGVVSGSTGVGVLLQGDYTEGSSLYMQEVQVGATSPIADGTLGRGVQVQKPYDGWLIDCDIADSTDAGVFIQLPVIDPYVVPFYLQRTSVSGVDPGTDATGDGVVITGDDDSGLSYDPSLFYVTLTDVSADLFEPTRAGVLFDGANGSSSTSVDASGSPITVYTQNGAAPVGSDSFSALTDPLPLISTPIAFDPEP